MLPLSALTQSEARNLAGLFFDLDDTFLEDGRLSQEGYTSLFSLKAAGLRLVALTGRPASWAELMARMWPVEAVIAENGAIAYRRQSARVLKLDTASLEVRAERRGRLLSLVEATTLALPGLTPTDDVAGRISDFTFDIGEHRHESEELIAAATALAEQAGARTTRSSVHLHFTFDRADKATGALSYLSQGGEDPTRGRRTFAFIGDSENDASAFAAFRCTVAVKNLRGRFSIPPRFITPSPKTAGFVEFTTRLLELRSGLVSR